MGLRADLGRDGPVGARLQEVFQSLDLSSCGGAVDSGGAILHVFVGRARATKRRKSDVRTTELSEPCCGAQG